MAQRGRVVEGVVDAGDIIADKNDNGACSIEQPLAEPDDAILMVTQPIRDTFSVIAAGDVHTIAGNGATELTSVVAGELLTDSDSAPQGRTNGQSVINIDPACENEPTPETAMQLITRVIVEMGVLTVTAVVHTAHSEQASGVSIGHNKLVYNLTLAAIFTLGVAEIFTGVLISMSGLTYRRRLWIGGIIMFLFIWPLVGILSVAGFP